MSTKHLTLGSECPPKKEGKIRLYGMRFCPYVHRIDLVLNAKDISYEVVNVNLKHKPEWLFKLHPQGKVPALDIDGQILIESLDIAEFLNEKYPEPPLYPADPEKKAKDKELIQKFGKVTGAFLEVLHDKEKKPLKEYINPIFDTLKEFEDELAYRGSPFFGGDKPGMVDFMMWPWAERSKVPAQLLNEEMKFPKEKYPNLVKWRQAMLELDAVKRSTVNQDIQLKFYRSFICGEPNPNFDEE